MRDYLVIFNTTDVFGTEHQHIVFVESTHNDIAEFLAEETLDFRNGELINSVFSKEIKKQNKAFKVFTLKVNQH